MNSTAGWFEVRHNELLVWEGVCALSSPTFLSLFKIVPAQEVAVIVLEPEHHSLEVSSEGYWQCVELKGSLANGGEFYYHADGVKKARKMLDHLKGLSPISHIRLRLDDNPLRLGELESSRERLLDWLSLVNEYSRDVTVVVDRNMPL